MFPKSAFEASTADIMPTPNRIFGSCAFELADLLQLLPGQCRSQEMRTELLSFHDSLHDEETYYCRCSREGLLQLLAQHFFTIQESPEQLSVQTTIELFTLIRTERRLLVRLNANERASNAKAPDNQDYSVLKKCAAGLWSLRERDVFRYGHIDSVEGSN